jgi:hypothetical protein
MRISKLMAVGASGCALVAAVTLPATAGSAKPAAGHHPAVASKTKTFPSTLSPHSPKPGQTLTLKGHGAKKSTLYTCVLVVIKGANYTIDTHTKNVKSTKSGKISCKMKYEPYSTISITGGAGNHCPVSKKNKKAGYRCGMAVSTTSKSSATIQYFTPKK